MASPQMTEAELQWLTERAAEASSVVEIGSWKGRSTAALLSGCKGTVTAVDHFLGSPDDERHKEAATTDIHEQDELSLLRSRGWSVAVHNDYRLSGNRYTFWLLTHPSGRWVKGEGETDRMALLECQRQIDRRSLEGPPHPYAVRIKDNGANASLTLTFNRYEQAEKYWRWAERLQDGR